MARAIAGAAALSLGAIAVGEVFVPCAQGQASKTNALRGVGKETGAASQSSPTSMSSVSVLGAATVAIVAATRRRSDRTACHAEPVSAAAAAAVAAAKAAGAGKAVAAAKGAVKAAGAVAGAAGTGSAASNKDGKEVEYDEFIANKKMMPTDRGTPEYAQWQEERRKMKEVNWAVDTGRNSDGVGGARPTKRGDGDLYDPLSSSEPYWKADARSQGIEPGQFNPATQLGAMAPLGYWDPLGFCKAGNEDGFRNLRTAEIKHGRVAMMAAIGAVVQHYVKFPSFGGVPSGLDAVNVAPGSYGMVALFALAGVMELSVWTENPNLAPGNFGDPVGLNQYTKDMRERELNNGRFAMFAAIGIIAAEILTGKDAVEQLGFK